MVNYLFHEFTISHAAAPTDRKSLIAFAVFVTGALMFPLAGWLADIYIGRYKVIKACLRIMLLGAIMFNITSALEYSLPVELWYLNTVAALLIIIGLSGFQSNIIQFSLDQLLDSSTFEITSFILFYVWSYFAANLVVTLAFDCVCDGYKPVSLLVFPIFLSLAVSFDFLFSHWLVKEPVSRNPLKLIFHVLHYAVKNKYPRQRSAFTYWEDKHYSRIDLAKSKYGGPFTTEEVEDVKTFFQILVIVIVVCFFLGIPVNSGNITHSEDLLNFHGMPHIKCSSKTPDCFKSLVPSLFVFLGIPFWEFLFYPLLWRCVMKLKILQKLGLGMMFILLYLMSRISFDVFGQVVPHSHNKTFPCPMSHRYSDHYSISYWWLLLPGTFYDLGGCLIAVAGLEFISAQCPYSMKGLMFGVVYLAIGFSACLFYPLSFPFNRDGFHGWGGLNCMFWYLLACVLSALAIGVVFLIVSSRYKNRQREENLPSQQFLADVYSDHMHTNNKGVSMSVSGD